MIQNLILGILFFENITSGIQCFYICPDVPVDITSVIFLISDFLSEVSTPTKTSKKIIHFKIQFRSKNLTHFTNLNSLDIGNNMLPQHSQKPFWLYIFSSRHVSVWCQKKYLHCTLSLRQRTAFLKHFESKCQYISIHLVIKMFVPET